MRNSKLYSILKYFDKYEQNRLRKYLESPYFNKNETLVALFDLLAEDINKPATTAEWPKEDIWQQLLAAAPYDDVRFRKYLSELLKLVEGFLAQQIYEENPLHQAAYLIEAVGRKKMDKLYNSTMRSARRLSDQQPHKPASYYYYQYEIEKNYYDLTESENKRFEKTNAEEISKNLDYFFLAEKMRVYCQIVLAHQSLISEKYDLLFMEEIIAHLKKHDYANIPAIAIYHQVLLVYTESENQDHYFKLKKLLNQYALDFPQKEALSIYYSAINYCIGQINKGNQTFLEESFELYHELFEKGIVFMGNDSIWAFRNLCVVSLRLGRYDWTENFILNYQHKLPEASRENAVTYNLAQLYFYQKRYNKVIEQLRNVEYEEMSYNLNSKTMLLATYYEMDEIEPLYSLMDTFRTYLNRRKDLPPDRRELYTNLIKFAKKMTKILPKDKKAIEKLQTEITNTKSIASKSWLLEKVAEL